MNTRLTKNIWRHELACKCGCGYDSMDFETINVVQEMCDHFAKELGIDKVTLIINSAARCLKYNRKPFSEGGPGSNDNSQHPLARALDVTLKEVTPYKVWQYLNEKYPNRYGLGRYNTFTHVDTASGGARRW